MCKFAEVVVISAQIECWKGVSPLTTSSGQVSVTKAWWGGSAQVGGLWLRGGVLVRGRVKRMEVLGHNGATVTEQTDI